MIKRKSKGSLANLLSNMDESSLARTRNRMLLAAKISDAVRKRGLTQKEFAHQMGKSESEVSEWLSGDRNFTVDSMTDIERFLSIRLLDTQVLDVVVLENSSIDFPISKNSKTVEMYPSGMFSLSSNGMTKFSETNVG